MSNLPPLSAVRAFEAASRHLSFTAAADELGMTQAAVSYQIRLLEEKLGLQLFFRRTRKVELTEQGSQLSSKVIDSFSTLRLAFEELSGQAFSQISVSSNTTFAMNWLANRLVQFQILNPDLAVRILPYGPNEDPAFSNSDIVVSACVPPPKDWISHKIIQADFSPLLTPHLAETVGGIDTPSDLLKLPLVDPHDKWWPVWFEAAGVRDVDFSAMPNTHMGSQALAGNRALAGQGVAILTPYFYKTALETGQLIQPFDLTCRTENMDWYLSYPTINRNSRKVRLFRDWVNSELENDGIEDTNILVDVA